MSWGMGNTYLSVFREKDGLEVICEVTEAEDSISFFMKERIDECIKTNGESELLGEYY